MTSLSVAFLLLPLLFIFVLSGFHIAYVLGGLSCLGIILMTGSAHTGLFILASTCFEALRGYAFATVQLFILMGALMSHSGVAKDLFKLADILLRRLPGGLGIATIMANTVFGAVTGVSVASAAVFSQIAAPEMVANNYNKRFATGCIAGSAVLGMLIPPSLLMVIYGMLAEQSIGKMFVAGLLPGLILALMFSLLTVLLAIFFPKEIFQINNKDKLLTQEDEETEKVLSYKLMIGVLPICATIVVVLGGMWAGVFTPTEAGAIGSFAALVVALLTGMRWEGLKKALLDTAGSVSVILLLLMTASMYSRMLTLSGFVTTLTDKVINLGTSPYVILSLFMIFVIFLGMVLDSTSILILTVPVMTPIMQSFGFDLIWFGIVLIVAIECGLITPPFGINVFTVKATSPIPITVEEIFRGSVPFLFVMLLVLVIIVMFPFLSTWLPSLI